MDSQHRHELAENELANWLETAVEQVKPFAALIVIGVVGLIAVLVAYGYYRDSSASNRAAEWSQFTTATMDGAPNLRVLETAAEDLQGAGAPANWTNITWAEGRLYEASEQLFISREKAMEAINSSREAFEALRMGKGVSGQIRERAQLGLARSYELEGNTEQAMIEYKKIDGAFADIAAARVEALEKPQAKSDLRWLATAESPAGGSLVGLPDAQPDFAPDDLDIAPAGEQAEPEANVSLEDLLQGYEKQDQVDLSTGEEDEPSGAESQANSEDESTPSAQSVTEDESAADETSDTDSDSSDPIDGDASDDTQIDSDDVTELDTGDDDGGESTDPDDSVTE